MNARFVFFESSWKSGNSYGQFDEEMQFSSDKINYVIFHDLQLSFRPYIYFLSLESSLNAGGNLIRNSKRWWSKQQPYVCILSVQSSLS